MLHRGVSVGRALTQPPVHTAKRAPSPAPEQAMRPRSDVVWPISPSTWSLRSALCTCCLPTLVVLPICVVEQNLQSAYQNVHCGDGERSQLQSVRLSGSHVSVCAIDLPLARCRHQGESWMDALASLQSWFSLSARSQSKPVRTSECGLVWLDW